ncbi:hypothetical protein [Arthrobacter sp. UYCu712]|uniref:hypothetical protein n=1 Tax=Arthrobacter sp. UYCu712 TaxID=3156340 RepID=UPI0033913EDC
MAPRKVRYIHFREEVRKYNPNDLIPFLAAEATRHQDLTTAWDDRWVKGFPPWFLAAAARDSLVYGNVNGHRNREMSPGRFITMRNLFTEAHDNPIVGASMTMADLALMLGRYAYEQFPYQSSVMEELARPYILFSDTDVPEQYRRPEPDEWKDVLGGTIEQALSASFIIFVGVMHNNGVFDPAVFTADWYSQVDRVVPSEVGLRVLDILTATVEEAREDGRSAPELPDYLQRYSYNPLVKTPLIDIGDGLRYAPQPQFVLRAMTTENLYYRGMRQWAGDNFGAALGMRVQAYTGRQLRHSGEHTVIEEFRWEQKKRGGVDSSDWFLVTPQVTVLIECKSARMGYAAKAGTPDGVKQANTVLGKAFGQIRNNADEIRAGNPAYAHIPADRPLVGLVVTAEPFYTANTPPVREVLPDPGIPTMTISLRELELLAALSPSEVGAGLEDIVANDELYTWPLALALPKVLPNLHEDRDNSLLSDAYETAFLPLTERWPTGGPDQ